jgi:hypothetical protein
VEHSEGGRIICPKWNLHPCARTRAARGFALPSAAVRGRASGATSSCDHACSKAGRRLHRPFPLRPRRPPVTRLRCFCLRRAGPALRHRSHDASSLGRDRGGTVPAGRSSRSTSRSSDRDQQGVCPGVPARKGNAAVRPATRIEDAHCMQSFGPRRRTSRSRSAHRRTLTVEPARLLLRSARSCQSQSLRGAPFAFRRATLRFDLCQITGLRCS